METLVGPFAWYVRRSDSKSDLDRQRKMLLDWCRDNQVHVPDSLKYEDTGSRDLSAKRPDFQRMIRDAQHGKKFRTILVPNFDRFGMEDPDEAGYYRCVLNKANVTLYSIEPGEGDLTRKDNETIIRLFFKAEASRIEQLKKGSRSITGKASLLHKGATFMGGPCPYGYDKRCRTEAGEVLWDLHHLAPQKRIAYMPDNSTRKFFGDKNTHPVKARSDKIVLIPSRDTSRIEAVKTIFRLWTQHDMSILAICKRLNADGHRHYGDLWKPTGVRGILANPVYTGAIVFNRRKWGRFASVEDGREIHHEYKNKFVKYHRTRDKWIVVPNAHDPLIDPATWEKAEAKLKALERSKTLPPRHPDLWLRRFAYCAHCGSRMQARHINGAPYLFCGTRRKDMSIGDKPKCDFNSVRHDRLEEGVKLHFSEIMVKLTEGDLATLKELHRKADEKLGLAQTQLRLMGEDLRPLAKKLGVPVEPLMSLLERINKATEGDQKKREAVGRFINDRDAKIKKELAELEERHKTITQKWATASPLQAPHLKKLCDEAEDRITTLRGQVFQTWAADLEARGTEFSTIVGQIEELRNQLRDGDGTAKAEALRPLLSRMVLEFEPKTGTKAKSRLKEIRFDMCDTSDAHVRGLREILLQVLHDLKESGPIPGR